jgi:TDG/mug DNA glycosylase family protein
VDRATVEVYEQRGGSWAARRRPVRRDDARAFGARLGRAARRIDLGCGAGRYTTDLGAPVIGLDAARAMLELCRRAAPRAALVQADLEALPLGHGVLQGAWANMSYLHLPAVRLPAALADLHRATAPGAPLDIQVLAGEYEGRALPADDIGGRYFASFSVQRLADVVVGAGFDVESVEVDDDVVRARAVRARTLPDFVGPDMAVLVVGLNPSLYAADAGVGFARPGNRFWPAAVAAGLVERDRDPWDALHAHHVGMTDLVKRATPNAAAVTDDEYRAGMARVERLCGWLEPGVVCFVGLTGWRRAQDRAAVAGAQTRTLAGRPVYVMPSTSGANAHARPDGLRAHLAEVRAMARRGAPRAGGARGVVRHDAVRPHEGELR